MMLTVPMQQHPVTAVSNREAVLAERSNPNVTFG
jgi:hypothetical protein